MPFVVEKIREGDFHLNQAMREITGLLIWNEYDVDWEKFGDEISRSRMWVRWWEENKSRYIDAN